MPKEFLVCGFSRWTSRTRAEYELIHLLGADLRMYTAMRRAFEEESDLEDLKIGEVLLVDEEDVESAFGIRKEQPWHVERYHLKGVDSFEGPVRGHVITFNARYGVQVWLYAEAMTKRGATLVRVLVFEDPKHRANLRTQEQIQEYWLEGFMKLRYSYPTGLLIRAQRNARTQKFEYVEEYDDDSPISDVGAEGGGELPEGAPR